MSYDIRLVDPVTKERIVIDDEHHIIGGTYQIGGTKELWLNITWNYAKYFYDLIDKELGIRWLYGKSAVDTIPKLNDVIDKLKDDVDEDYWAATEGNAKQSLIGLLTLAKMRPDAIWEGD